MTRKVRALVLSALVGGIASLAMGQTSSYFAMTAAGTWQGWNPNGRNMVNYSNYAWEGIFFLTTAQTNEFKFTANGSWNVRTWGENNQTITNDPLSGFTEIGGGNIRHVAIRDGFYRFRMHETSLAYSVELLGYSLFESNLIRNGSFETAGSSATEAENWELGYPTYTGGRYGSSGRVDWRAIDGSYEVFMGTTPNFGGWYQDAPAGEDFEYEISAWFWADAIPPYGPWTAGVQELKMEFYGPQYGSPLATVATNFHDITDQYKQKTVRARAPPGTAWARFVMGVGSVGSNGSLQMDNVYMTSFPIRTQSFDSWSFATNNGNHVRGAWLVSTGRVVYGEDTNDIPSVTNLAYSGASLALFNNHTSNPGGSVISPRLADGVGRVSFWYRHGSTSTNDEPTNALSLVIQKSGNGTAWSGIATNDAILSQEYQFFSQFVYDPTSYYVRVIHNGGTNEVLIDDLSVALATPIARSQNFNTWPTTNNIPGVYTSEDWVVGTGTISSLNAKSGQAAKLMGVSNGTNFVRSPQFTNGYGTISFFYARGTNGSGATAFQLQQSPDGVNWTALATVSNITSTAYTEFEEFYYVTNSSFLRIANQFVVSPTGTAAELINEGFAGFPIQTNTGWAFTSIGTYDTDASSGLAIPSLRFDLSDDRAVTPVISNPTSLTFWTKGQSLSGSTLLLESQTTDGDTNWFSVTNYTTIPNTERTNVVALSTNVTRLRWTYTKVTGNLSFDDVVVVGAPVASQPPQQLLIDDIVIANPELLRFMDFNDWSGATSLGDHKFKGWKIGDGRVDSFNPVSGLGARLDGSPASGQYIQSPFFPDGIGSISFDFAQDQSGTPPVYRVEISTNGTTWTNLGLLNVSNFTYQSYNRYEYQTNGGAFRLFHTSGASRAAFDNINIERPSPPADVDLSGYIDPPNPFTNDTVTVHAVAIPLYGAKNLAVTSYYRIGTSGVFTVLPMKVENFISYGSYNPAETNYPPPAYGVLPQPAGTAVQWYVSCTFTGPGAHLTSPRYYPSGAPTNPAIYRIPRAKPGQVWINEVNYYNGFFNTNAQEFIELAGPTGFNLSGWGIELQKTTNINLAQPLLFGKYVIPTTTLLPADTANLGFWVLGQSNVDTRDMLLTNYLSEDQLPLGVRLLNEAGGLEQALSFDGYVYNCTYVQTGDDLFTEDVSVSLVGSGTNFATYVWSNIPVFMTPGAMNFGQSFGTPITGGIPTNVWIRLITMGTNVTLVATGNTNTWGVMPYYATNLNANPQAWLPVTPFNNTLAGDTNTITFTRPTNAAPFFYTIFATNGP